MFSPISASSFSSGSPASGPLAKTNAFDLVVTVALGSTLVTILLSADVSYLEGLLALVGFQFVAAWVSTRWAAVRRLLESEPVLLLHDGRLLDDVLRRQRVTGGEVRQAVRSQGIGSVTDVAAVVLETDGSFSVVPSAQAGDGSALVDVAGLVR